MVYDEVVRGQEALSSDVFTGERDLHKLTLALGSPGTPISAGAVREVLGKGGMQRLIMMSFTSLSVSNTAA